MKWLIIVPLALIALAVVVFVAIFGFIMLYEGYVHWQLRRMLDKNERLAGAQCSADLQTPDWSALHRHLKRTVPGILKQAYADIAFISKTHTLARQPLQFVPIRELSKLDALLHDGAYFPIAELGEDPLFLKAGRDESDAVYQYSASDDPDAPFEVLFPSLDAFMKELGFVVGGLSAKRKRGGSQR